MASAHGSEEKPPGSTRATSSDDNDEDIFQNADSTAQLALVLGDLRNTLRDQSRVLASPRFAVQPPGRTRYRKTKR
jgi:hypothetical protein